MILRLSLSKFWATFQFEVALRKTFNYEDMYSYGDYIVGVSGKMCNKWKQMSFSKMETQWEGEWRMDHQETEIATLAF